MARSDVGIVEGDESCSHGDKNYCGHCLAEKLAEAERDDTHLVGVDTRGGLMRDGVRTLARVTHRDVDSVVVAALQAAELGLENVTPADLPIPFRASASNLVDELSRIASTHFEPPKKKHFALDDKAERRRLEKRRKR